jgi:hypothetical protein
MRIVALCVHTVAIYLSAMHLSAWFVGRWFRWIMPLLGLSTVTRPADWYLSHLEIATIIPAFMIGYFSLTQSLSLLRKWIGEAEFDWAAKLAWFVPSFAVVHRLLTYHSPASVLYTSAPSAVAYLFDVQKTMPTWNNWAGTDPVRVWAQMSITAPFYAGISYCLGAVASKHRLLDRIFSRELPEREEPAADQPDRTADI